MQQSTTSSNAEENNNLDYSKAAVNDLLENTPFHILNFPEKGWCLSIGNQILTEPTKTVEETLDKLETEKWHIIMRLSAFMHQRIASEAIRSMEEVMKEQKEKNGVN